MKKRLVLMAALLFLFIGCASHVKKSSDLIIGSQNGKISSVESALKSGAKINGKIYPAGPTALFMASQNGHLEIVKFLLDNGADVNEKMTQNNTTPLLIASQNGHAEIVKLLLNQGADVSVMSTYGATALLAASQKSHVEILKLLLNKGAQVNVHYKTGYSPLHFAVSTKSTESIELLVQHRADLNLQIVANGATPLYLAANHGMLKAVRILVEAGADVNIPLHNGWTPIAIAAYMGHDSIVDIISRCGAKHTLHTYCALNNITKVQEMVKSAADANLTGVDGIPLICFAVRNSRLEISRYLLDKGADPDFKSKTGFSSLFAAVESHDTGMVGFLLENNADIGIKDNNGYTPLHLAAQLGDTPMVDFLLKMGAPVNSTNNTGRTALYDAALNNFSETVQHILKYAPDIQKGHNQWTPLHVAAKNGNIEIAQALLDNGASLNAIMSDTAESPIDIAYSNKQTAMLQFLIEYYGKKQTDHARTLFKSGDKTAAVSKLESSIRDYDDNIKELSRKAAINSYFSKKDTFTTDLASTLNSTLNRQALKTGNASLLGQTAVNDLYMRGSQKKASPDLTKTNYLKHLYAKLKHKYSLMADCIRKDDAALDCLNKE
ncbi:MAG: ankyrin repeat domain-containing protein [Proteobacteria bacterium]|nr:ankyrin repeat domain-containing protein [Pseudomonadota bacterium]MBU1584265.1 ankyrin repeat domain-containing protein [Pseudomonadota bacterium]MBU2455754.1 ankyrin repeat domain-containing protein [Pseudomonadota bacterium]MBU2630416.1 ankyrin repeat domain-containing protein [Pseudomonadota bacterium]